MKPTVERCAPTAPGECVILRVQSKVAVVETHATVNLGIVMGELTATHYRVVGFRRDGTGREYVAHLGACIRDECMAGSLQFCPKPNNHITAVNAWLKHIATHCHGWHEPILIPFMTAVLATYGAPFKHPRTVGARR